MKQKTLSGTSLTKLTDAVLPSRIKNKIELCINEEESYAADELVELAEEILSQIAAIGFAVYLQQSKQKTVYNDFLINLFTSNSHSYNAGPLFRWAGNMIKEADGETAKKLFPLFWMNKHNKVVLNEDFNHLSMLRNEVMHGFFVLPPERNKREAEQIAILLNKLNDIKLFENIEHNYHFLDRDGFKGNWTIANDEDWSFFNNCYAYSNLANRIRVELSETFKKEELDFVKKEPSKISEINERVLIFLNENKKGSLAIWHKPEDINAPLAYKSVIQFLHSKVDILPIFFRVQHFGLTITSTFLLKVIGEAMAEATGNKKFISDTIKAIKNKELFDKRKTRPVVVLYGVHIGLFNENHILKMVNTLFDGEISLIAFGEHYQYLDRYMNQSFELKSATYIPSRTQQINAMKNYLRFKGPSLEKEDEKEDYERLQEILKKLTDELEEVSKLEIIKVVARRFADKYNYPIEFVHECFAILNPFLQTGKEDFLKDEIDELYEFPKEITETSAIFLSLGRRDAKLEYKHKTLSL